MEDRAAVLCSGFVTKRGHFIKNWRRRYLTLTDDGQLRYYKGEKHKGSVSLTDSTRIARKTASSSDILWPSNATDRNSVAIITPERPFYFIFESRAEYKSWLKALSKFIKLPQSFLSEIAENRMRSTGSESESTGQDENLQKETEELKYLSDLTNHSLEASSNELVAMQSVEKVVGVMKRTQESAKVQAEACHCIQYLASRSKRLRNHCVKTEALELVRTAMKLHQNLHDVQLPGICFIQCYVHESDPMVRNQVLDEKYIRRICCGVKAVMGNRNVVEAGMITLWDITLAGNLDWICPAFINAGVFPMLIDILTMEGCDSSLVEAAFCLVSSLLSHDSMAEVFVHCGGVGTIVSVLKIPALNSQALNQTLTLILLLVLQSGKARCHLLEKDLVSFLLQCVEVSSRTVEQIQVQAMSLNVFFELARLESYLHDELLEKVLPICVKLMEDLSRDKDSLAAVLKFFQILLNRGGLEENMWIMFVSNLLHYLQLDSDNELIISLTITILANFFVFHFGAVSDAKVFAIMETNDSINALQKAINLFESNPDIQRFGCTLFTLLSYRDPSRMKEFGVMEMAGRAVRKFYRNCCVVNAGLMTIAELLGDDNSVIEFFNVDLFSTMMRAVHACLSSDSVQEYCIRILIRLTKDKLTADMLALTGHLSVVVMALKNTLEKGCSEPVLTQACIFLNVYATEEFIEFIHKENGCIFVLKALEVEDQEMNIQLQYNAISILSIAVSFVEDWWVSIDVEKVLEATLRILGIYRSETVFYLPIFAVLLSLSKRSNDMMQAILGSDVGVIDLCNEVVGRDCDVALRLRAVELLSALHRVETASV